MPFGRHSLKLAPLSSSRTVMQPYLYMPQLSKIHISFHSFASAEWNNYEHIIFFIVPVGIVNASFLLLISVVAVGCWLLLLLQTFPWRWLQWLHGAKWFFCHFLPLWLVENLFASFLTEKFFFCINFIARFMWIMMLQHTPLYISS